MLFFYYCQPVVKGRLASFSYFTLRAVYSRIYLSTVFALCLYFVAIFICIFFQMYCTLVCFLYYFFDVHTILCNVFMWCVFFAGSFEKRSVGFYSCVYSVLFLEAMSLKRKKNGSYIYECAMSKKKRLWVNFRPCDIIGKRRLCRINFKNVLLVSCSEISYLWFPVRKSFQISGISHHHSSPYSIYTQWNI